VWELFGGPSWRGWLGEKAGERTCCCCRRKDDDAMKSDKVGGDLVCSATRESAVLLQRANIWGEMVTATATATWTIVSDPPEREAAVGRVGWIGR